MAGTSFHIEVDDAPLRAVLDRLDAAGADMSPMFDEIGMAMVASTIRRFETETGPDGLRWAPSARVREEGGQTLTDEAHLRGSITHRAGPGAVTWGTNLVYAAIHQTGGTIHARGGGKLTFQIGGGWVQVDRVEIPARPFLGVDAGDEAEIVAIARDHIAGGLA